MDTNRYIKCINCKLSISGFTNFRESQIKSLAKRYTQPNILARKLVPSLSPRAFKEFYTTQNPVTFIIVRHPYERLLSAYRDKFENKKKYYYHNYGKFMISQFRHRGIRRFGKEFYQITKNDKRNYKIPYLNAVQRRLDDPTPTFWEFTRYIIEHKILNEHWRPASLMCSLCRVS